MGKIVEFKSKDNDFDRNFKLMIKKFNRTGEEKDFQDAKYYYVCKRVEYERIKGNLAKHEQQEIGLGFWYTLSEYEGNPLIKEFIAKCMIKEIQELVIEDNMYNSQSKSENILKKIEKIGTKQYLLDIIRFYDSSLSGYIETHIYLLKTLEENIKHILENEKMRNLEINKEELLDELYDFINYEENDFFMTEILYYINIKHNIDLRPLYYNTDEEFKDNEYMDEYEVNRFIEQIDFGKDHYEKVFNNLSLKKQLFLTKLDKFIINYINEEKHVGSYLYIKSKKNI